MQIALQIRCFEAVCIIKCFGDT